MAKFILAYHGTVSFNSQEDAKAHHIKFVAWVGGLGAAALEPMNPVGKSKTVGAESVEDNGGSNPLGGYTVIEVTDINAAVAIAQSCPHLSFGTLEVAEIKSMSM